MNAKLNDTKNLWSPSTSFFERLPVYPSLHPLSGGFRDCSSRSLRDVLFALLLASAYISSKKGEKRFEYRALWGMSVPVGHSASRHPVP